MSAYHVVENARGRVNVRARGREDILLRGLCEDDVPRLVELLSDPENSKNDLSMADMTSKDILSLAVRWCTNSSPLEHCMMLITLHGMTVGVCGFGVIREITGTGDNGQERAPKTHYEQATDAGTSLREGVLGIVVSEPFRGEGLAREALLMALTFGFQELEFSRVVMGTTSKNIAMRKLMESPPPKGLGLQASVTTPDKFGNDLEWSLEKDTWHQLSAANLPMRTRK